jgi:hypothetical protein
LEIDMTYVAQVLAIFNCTILAYLSAYALLAGQNQYAALLASIFAVNILVAVALAEELEPQSV